MGTSDIFVVDLYRMHVCFLFVAGLDFCCRCY